MIERKVTNHFERVSFYGPRSDLTRTEMSNQFAGNKQSNSDSAFMVSSRDGFPQARPKSLDGLHLMKILRNARGERPRRSHDEAMLFVMHPMRPTPMSRILQPPSLCGFSLFSLINGGNHATLFRLPHFFIWIPY
ncbi:hypothetical protein CsSME_00042639 [Camellia sinensis var. sinensis]